MGDAGNVFKFLAMPMSPDIFEEGVNLILSEPLGYSKLGPYLIPALRTEMVRLSTKH